MITTESNVAVGEKSITEYLQATFIEEQGAIKQEIFDAEQAVKQAELSYQSANRLAAKGLIKQLQLQGERFKLDSAAEKLKLKKTRLKALEEFKKEKQIEKLESDLRAAEARLEAASARVDLAQTNVDQHEEQLRFHTIVAPQDGMVIHPKAAAHRSAPDVEEGANVHTNQVLLIMPDLEQMQVKLGIHESMIDRVEPGLVANVTVGEATLIGEVSEVAKVTKPATWYTGNVVKFDTIVAIESHAGLKPGLSAEVEVIIAEHNDVLTIPVAAIVETGEEHHCWVKSDRGGAVRRPLKLGDSNDLFVVVESGLKEGDEVVLNPLAYVDEAQEEVLKPPDQNQPNELEQAESGRQAKPPNREPKDRSPDNLIRPPTMN
jgi:RND family efflux transporter MFP subunit